MILFIAFCIKHYMVCALCNALHLSKSSSFSDEIEKEMLMNFTKFVYSPLGCCLIRNQQETRLNLRKYNEIPKTHILESNRIYAHHAVLLANLKSYTRSVLPLSSLGLG